jgi:8-oxo-dGTP pyrophosphatase MutT (NUDIX family)
MEDRLVHIARAVQGRAPLVAERDEPFYEAAVALILRPREGILEALFIKRATRESDPWSGQVALPGGRFDKSDASLEATAVRETMEEVGLDLAQHGTILGALDELRPRTPVLPPVIVRPYVAVIREKLPLVISDEVAEVFWAPLDVLVDPASRVETEIMVRGFKTHRPAIHYEGHMIWGMTEVILTSFAEIIA